MPKVVLASFLCLLCIACNNAQQQPPTIVGKWTEQNGTAWEFTPDGHAVIKGNAEATYKVTGDKTLTIEFHNEQNFAVDYSIELSATKLILHPEQAHGDGALPADWEESTVLVRSS